MTGFDVRVVARSDSASIAAAASWATDTANSSLSTLRQVISLTFFLKEIVRKLMDVYLSHTSTEREKEREGQNARDQQKASGSGKNNFSRGFFAVAEQY